MQPWADAVAAEFGPFYDENGNESWATGYGDMRSTPENRHVDIFWTGSQPEDLNSLVDKAPEGFTVDVVEAEYDMNTLSQAGRDLIEGGAEIKNFKGFDGATDIARVRPARDRSGVEVFVGTQAAARAETATEERLAELTEVPINSIAFQEAAVPTVTRQNDASPWSGGSFVEFAAGFCTTGVGVKRTDTGDEFLLTANHCALNHDQDDHAIDEKVYEYSGAKLGEWRSGWGKYPTDSIRIRPTTENVQARIFAGPSSTSAVINVKGTNASIEGNYVCQSGGNTGLRCGLQLEQNGQQVSLLGVTLTAARIAEKVSGTVQAVQQGDSGGPVYAASSTGEAYIKGVTSGGLSPMPCASGAVVPGGLCFGEMIYVQLSSALAAQTSTLLTVD